jgi:hypothetical protein
LVCSTCPWETGDGGKGKLRVAVGSVNYKLGTVEREIVPVVVRGHSSCVPGLRSHGITFSEELKKLVVAPRLPAVPDREARAGRWQCRDS